MSKKLLFLLPLATLALVGCPKPAEGGDASTDVPQVSELTITGDNIAEFVPEGKTYVASEYSFTVSGIAFKGSAGTGLAAANIGEGQSSYYNENKIMQWAKVGHDTYAEGGLFKNTTEFPAKSIEVDWVATYSSEAGKYWPVCKAGAEADSLSVVAANETTDPAAGTKIDGAKEKTYDVYSYRSTFTLPEGVQFFQISAGNGGTAYIRSIHVSK
jgi:hypothetical protein